MWKTVSSQLAHLVEVARLHALHERQATLQDDPASAFKLAQFLANDGLVDAVIVRCACHRVVETQTAPRATSNVLAGRRTRFLAAADAGEDAQLAQRADHDVELTLLEDEPRRDRVVALPQRRVRRVLRRRRASHLQDAVLRDSAQRVARDEPLARERPARGRAREIADIPPQVAANARAQRVLPPGVVVVVVRGRRVREATRRPRLGAVHRTSKRARGVVAVVGVVVGRG